MLWIAALLAVMQVLGAISAVHAVLYTRTSQGAIAWVVSLNTVAPLAVPAYWVFGRAKFQGYVTAARLADDLLDEQKDDFHKRFAPYELAAPDRFPEYAAIRELARSPFLNGNHVDLLVDGEQTYDSIAAGLEQATDYILFQFYIIRPDASGERFKEILLRKAREGVRVYVLYDELGSAGLSSDWLQDFRDAGAQISMFNTRQGRSNRFQLNFRNHRKIVVVDGMHAWVGGLNVGDDYLGEYPELSPWRDTHTHIHGPAAAVAQSVFWTDWHWAQHALIPNLNWTPTPAGDGTGKPVLVLGSGPSDELETASLFFTTVINAAHERLWIATPYFVPDEATMTALRLALLRGLDVRILTPTTNDNWLVRHAANVYLSDLARMGARIYRYQQGFMHQKVVIMDDTLSLIGTVNFDNRSFRLNFEVTAAVADPAFNTEVEAMLEADLANAEEVIDYDLSRESLWERLKAHCSSLLAPVL